MLRFKRLLFLLPFLFLLASCETYYWANTDSGGYDEKQLDKKTWSVRMSVPDHKSLKYAEDLCLSRCAELSLDTGGIGFILDSTVFGSKSRFNKYPALMKGGGDSGTYGGGIRIRKFRTVTMKMTVVADDSDLISQENVFDAHSVWLEMKKKYKLRKGEERQQRYWDRVTRNAEQSK